MANFTEKTIIIVFIASLMFSGIFLLISLEQFINEHETISLIGIITFIIGVFIFKKLFKKK